MTENRQGKLIGKTDQEIRKGKQTGKTDRENRSGIIPVSMSAEGQN